MVKNTRIIIARLEKNITQTELAERVGITRQTMCLIEKGEYNPSLKLCLAICHVLGKTLNDLFWEEKKNEK
ncbi:MAG: helix-turn-helix transcriptional regulator [Bacilli bacterium]|nr:helix-turn-helix transcriptional regulator [Bacilli bacterium]